MNKRNKTIDFVKGFAICLMIYDHIAMQGKLICSFHMPLFFILSGYFLKVSTLGDVSRKKIKQLLIPYMIFNLAAIMVGCLKEGIYYKTSIEHIIKNYIPTKLMDVLLGRDIWLTWFLWVLFFSILLVSVTYVVVKKNWIVVVIITGMYSLIGKLLSSYYTMETPLYLDVILIATFFVAAGAFYREHLEERIKKLSVFWKTMILIGCLILWMVDLKYGFLVIALHIFRGYPLCILGAVAATCLVVAASKYLQKIPVVSHYFCWCGRNSLKFLFVSNIIRQFIDWNNKFPTGTSIFVMFLIQLAIHIILVFLYEQIERKVKIQNGKKER